MLTPYDIEFMKESVRDVIKEWNTTIVILEPLPIDEQPNYNRIMREFTGEIKYKTILMSAERKDIVQNNTNRLLPDDVEYGIKNAGILLYSIPNVIPKFDNDGNEVGVEQYKPHKESVIIVDDTNDRYYIRIMKDRIGETLIELARYAGNVPDGSNASIVPSDGLAD